MDESKTRIQKHEYIVIMIKMGNSLSKRDKRQCVLSVIKGSMKSAQSI